MIFKGIREDNGWITVEYAATWRYGYDFMLDAAQVIVYDFKEELQRFGVGGVAGSKCVEIVGEIKERGGILRSCKSLENEHGMIITAGISGIMECPIQLAFYNQTNAVRLDCPIKKYFDDNGEHVFDNYVNSVEIKAYCADAERKTAAQLRSAAP